MIGPILRPNGTVAHSTARPKENSLCQGRRPGVVYAGARYTRTKSKFPVPEFFFGTEPLFNIKTYCVAARYKKAPERVSGNNRRKAALDDR